MIDLYVFILCSIVLIFITAFMSHYFISKLNKKRTADIIQSTVREEVEKKLQTEFQRQLQIRFLEGKEEGKDGTINLYKESSEFKTLLENERIKGYENGKQEGLSSYKSSPEYDSFLKYEHSKGIKEGKEIALEEYKNSPEMVAIKENEFRKGKEEGASEEKSKFSIKYNPIIKKKETFLKKSIKAGYSMQLFYCSLPIGEPTERMLDIEEKSKDENILKLTDFAMKAIDSYISIASGQGIIAVPGSRKPQIISE